VTFDQSFTADEVAKYLVGQGVKESVADEFRQQNVDGTALVYA
jgi:hypothetical protein